MNCMPESTIYIFLMCVYPLTWFQGSIFRKKTVISQIMGLVYLKACCPGRVAQLVGALSCMPKRLWVWLPVRAHTKVMSSTPSLGAYGRQLISVFLSHPSSLSKINKHILRGGLGKNPKTTKACYWVGIKGLSKNAETWVCRESLCNLACAICTHFLSQFSCLSSTPSISYNSPESQMKFARI